MEVWYALPGDARAARHVHLKLGAETPVDALSARILEHAQQKTATAQQRRSWSSAMRLSAGGRDLAAGKTLAQCGLTQSSCSVFCLAR